MTVHPNQDFAGVNLLLYEVWRNLPRRSGSKLPRWEDIKAAHLTSVMKHVWVLEYAAPDAMMVRFMGSEVAYLAGQDTTGKDFVTTRIAPEHRAMMRSLYRTTFEHRCGTRLKRILRSPDTNTKEMLTTFFPMRFGEAGSWGLLGCSEMRTSNDGALTLAGTADFATSHLAPPQFIDIGFGTPDWKPPSE